jgi:putative endonuclease
MDRRASGAHAEGIARRFLGAHGLELLCENYRCRLGELDLVMREADTLVIVEVRMRTHARYGGAVASVDRFKQQRIVRATEHLLMKHPRLTRLPVRFDVVSFEPRSAGRIEWIRGAFLAAR